MFFASPGDLTGLPPGEFSLISPGTKKPGQVTQGRDSGSKATLSDAISAARNSGTLVYIVLARNPASKDAERIAQNIAEGTGGRVILVSSVASVNPAFDQISTILNRRPRDYDELVSQAKSELSAGQTEQALVATKNAVALRPNGWDAHMIAGYVLQSQKQYDEAVAEFTAALANAPEDKKTSVKKFLAQSISERAAVTNFSDVMGTTAATSDLGDQYQIHIAITIPFSRANLITIYGFQEKDGIRSDLPSGTFMPVRGNWQPGERVTFQINVPKKFADAAQGWHLHFLVGTTDNLWIASSNLLATLRKPDRDR